MRKIKGVLFLALILGLTTQAQSVFTLSGKIENAAKAEARVEINRSWLPYYPEVIAKPIQSGQFTFSIPMDRNRMLELVIGTFRMPLYAEPGKDLSLSFSASDPTAISVDGSCAQENALLQKFFRNFSADYNDSLMTNRMLSTAIDPFEMEAFAQRKKQSDFINSATEKSACSANFISFLEDQVSYHYWHQLFAYPIINANSNKNVLTVNPLPELMLEGIEKIKVNNEQALVSDAYREFLKYYVVYNTSKGNGFQKFKDPSVSADRKMAVAKDKLNGKVYTYWLARFITDECERLSEFMVKRMKAELRTLDPANDFLPVVNAHCDGKTASALPASGKNEEKASGPSGKQSDDLDLTDTKGKHVSLRDFKGKVVYIDFWASWCGPCRMMMPYSKQLHEQLTDKEKKNIIFLYISIDAAHDAWLKGITDMDIQGVNVNSPGNWGSLVCKYFQINSIPRYMIMDKKGNIVNINAPRPSEPTLLEELRKYAAE